MNVLFISQCSGNALKETRRILDQFAERIGDRVWQTPITEDGLAVVARLLRQSARKNTAVACHWIHGKNRTDLLWIIGDKRQFNISGAVPTNVTGQEILPMEDNNWQSGEICRLMTAMAALWHDVGKIGLAFQTKLLGGPQAADAFRHEWLSLRIFQAFVELSGSNDQAWLENLLSLKNQSNKGLTQIAKEWLKSLCKDSVSESQPAPFLNLPPLAKAIGWLILGHHRLPIKHKGENTREIIICQPWKSISPDWGYTHEAGKKGNTQKTWKIKENSLPCFSQLWRERCSKIASKLVSRIERVSESWLDNTYLMHISRLGLMLADHIYSARKEDEKDRLCGDKSFEPYANSAFSYDHASGSKKRILCQKLDEHLAGVERLSSQILWRIGRLRASLPVVGLLSSKRFRKQSRDKRFKWQDKAWDLAASFAGQSEAQGFFGINMASTGCGKTLANGKICHALSGAKGARFTVALGLKTLTFQTGHAYRTQMGLGADELAVLAGDQATRELWETSEAHKDQIESLEDFGSESMEPLIQSEVLYDGIPDSALAGWMASSQRLASLISAPVLACTIDHLIPATDGLRGGRQIAPMLRLMTSDLVLDEPDDFNTGDLYALSRLVFWTGMLGGRLILSSATLSPSFARGMFNAYQAGRKQYNANMGLDSDLPVLCTWFDEFGCKAEEVSGDEIFAVSHAKFTGKRIKNLSQQEVRRLPVIRKIANPLLDKEECIACWVEQIRNAITELHVSHHTVDPVSGKRISFGLVRMANINQMVKTTQLLATIGPDVGKSWHIACYHSQYPMLMRSRLESRLDKLLFRKKSDTEFLSQPSVQRLLASCPSEDHVVIILATPVAEVGRDHDYDWAIVEPSSMRSIIQLAGRVRRHRSGTPDSPNICLLNRNWRALQDSTLDKPVFIKPGFESESFLLNSHELSSLMTPEQLSSLDASARIIERKNPDINIKEGAMMIGNLADLEHVVLKEIMLGSEHRILPTINLFWKEHASMTGEVQRKTPFRNHMRQEIYLWYPDELREEPVFSRLEDNGDLTSQQTLCSFEKIDLPGNISWLEESDYMGQLRDLASEKDISLQDCARRFGRVRLPVWSNNDLWRYHPQLGFFQ